MELVSYLLFLAVCLMIGIGSALAFPHSLSKGLLVGAIGGVVWGIVSGWIGLI